MAKWRSKMNHDYIIDVKAIPAMSEVTFPDGRTADVTVHQITESYEPVPEGEGEEEAKEPT